MLNITVITYLLRSGGGFFLNYDHLQDDLFVAVLKAYVQTLMNNECIL